MMKQLASAVGGFVIGLVCVGTTWAMLLPHDFIGKVDAKQGGEIFIQVEYRWDGSDWVQDASRITGEAPNQEAMTEIDVGDDVLVRSLGRPGGRWVTLAKINPPYGVTDVYGDLAALEESPPLLGNYTIQQSHIPDCSSCGGCNCQVLQTNVTISHKSGWGDGCELIPGDSCECIGVGHKIDIAFMSGQASVFPDCPNSSPCYGPQPVSDFVIHVTVVDTE